jgi:hypothetical protein
MSGSNVGGRPTAGALLDPVCCLVGVSHVERGSRRASRDETCLGDGTFAGLRGPHPPLLTTPADVERSRSFTLGPTMALRASASSASVSCGSAAPSATPNCAPPSPPAHGAAEGRRYSAQGPIWPSVSPHADECARGHLCDLTRSGLGRTRCDGTFQSRFLASASPERTSPLIPDSMRILDAAVDML